MRRNIVYNKGINSVMNVCINLLDMTRMLLWGYRHFAMISDRMLDELQQSISSPRDRNQSTSSRRQLFSESSSPIITSLRGRSLSAQRTVNGSSEVWYFLKYLNTMKRIRVYNCTHSLRMTTINAIFGLHFLASGWPVCQRRDANSICCSLTELSPRISWISYVQF